MSGLGLAPDALPFLAALTVIAALLFAAGAWAGKWPVWMAGYFVVLMALVVTFFFRDPERRAPLDPAVFLAPADGRVVAVDRVREPDYLGGEAVRVAIYLSLLNVHVQRSPVGGVVDYVERRPGRFAPAWSPAAEENEAVSVGISTGRLRVLVRQIAGTVARRIVTYVEEGELVEQAERIGLIRFGSRVETFLPPDAEVAVEEGDRVTAGITVLARAPVPAGGAGGAAGAGGGALREACP